jgi:hypothetical protein
VKAEVLEERAIKCGVCAQEMQKAQWIKHIQQEHNYLAWIDGEPALVCNLILKYFWF